MPSFHRWAIIRLMSDKVLFEKTSGRWSVVKELCLWPVYAGLHKVTRKHLQQGQRQLTVFAFDHIAHNINLFGVYERAELETFFAWLIAQRPSTLTGTALDVGANIGNHGLYFTDYFDRVICFEPNPRTFKLLQLNSELAENMTCLNIGLSDSDGTATLHVDPSNMGGSSLYGKGRPQEIQVRRLDSVEVGGKVSLVKIDVEGHELKALAGAKQLIATHKPMILFEQHNEDFVNGKSAVIELLRAYGYQEFAIVMPHPHIPYGWPKFIRLGLTALCSLLLGKRMRVTVTHEIGPSFYPFIVALP